jgi:hypothetical protein
MAATVALLGVASIGSNCRRGNRAVCRLSRNRHYHYRAAGAGACTYCRTGAGGSAGATLRCTDAS